MMGIPITYEKALRNWLGDISEEGFAWTWALGGHAMASYGDFGDDTWSSYDMPLLGHQK